MNRKTRTRNVWRRGLIFVLRCDLHREKLHAEHCDLQRIALQIAASFLHDASFRAANRSAETEKTAKLSLETLKHFHAVRRRIRQAALTCRGQSCTSQSNRTRVVASRQRQILHRARQQPLRRMPLGHGLPARGPADARTRPWPSSPRHIASATPAWTGLRGHRRAAQRLTPGPRGGAASFRAAGPRVPASDHLVNPGRPIRTAGWQNL